MKKLFKIFVITLSLFMVVGCTTSNNGGGTTNGDDEKITIAYSVQTLENQYFVTISEGFKKYCEENGITSIVADGKQDAAEQVSQVENFIAQQVDAIVISPVNDKALVDVVAQAKEAGIPVIACNQDFEGSDAFITIPEYELGKALGDVTGKYITETWGDEAVEVLVLDYPEIESIIARGNGIREGILEYAPNANIVQSISANTPEKGAAAMETALQKFPNIKVVAGVNDSGVLGAYEVVVAAGKATDDFYMGGMDATDQALDLIKQGTAYKATIDINPKGTGKIIVDTVLKVLEQGPLTEEVVIDLNAVTKENVDEFITE